MFDEKQNEQAQAGQASTNEPVDMFASTAEKGEAPANLEPQVGTMYEEATEDSADTHESSGKRHMILAIIAIITLLLVIGVGISLFFFFQKSREQQPPQDILAPVTPTTPQEEQPTTPSEEVPPVTQEEQPVTPDATPTAPASVDTDSDGLTDAEEETAGTSSTLPDTDGDGLTDTEEIQTYKTNPLSADSDSDGYLDKEEIGNGFNPNGTGKLPTTLPAQ